MEVVHFTVGPLDTNCFLVHNRDEAVVIDPGGEPSEVIAYLRKHSLKLTHILCTHLHFDHTFGLHDLVVESGATVFASEEDRFMLSNELGRGGMWGLPNVDPYDFQGIPAGDFPLLGTSCKVLLTPGHTPGGLSFYFADLATVFAGDTLFYRSMGRFDFQGGSEAALLKSIREQLFFLPDATVVHTGHGLSTTIGDEKRSNPYAGDFALSML